jgi:Arc-like DNA binding dprotein
MAARDKATTVQLKVRMKEPLRAKLEEMAHRHGISMNAEIVARLEQSFEHQQRLEDVFGGILVYRLVRMVGAIMDSAGSTALLYRPSSRVAEDPDLRWGGDPYAYDQALQAAIYALEALRPIGEPTAPPEGLGMMGASDVGRRTAQKMLDALNSVLADRPSRGRDQ